MRKINVAMLTVAMMAFGLSFMLSGCNKPTDEMEKAKAAIEEAKQMNADCAAKEIQSAEQALNKGIDDMNSYNYSSARDYFEKAYSRALAAKNKNCEVTMAPPPEEPPPMKMAADSHTVEKGECLWWISEYGDIYNDPFQWPIIYDANRDEIDSTAHSYGHHTSEEDWIYPGQQFDIPRDASMDEIKSARKRAGAPAPYMPPGK